MEKFILKSSNAEVKLGDTIIASNNKDGRVFRFLLTDATLSILIKEGIIVKKNYVEPNKEMEASKHISFYIDSLAKRIGWTSENVSRYLTKLQMIDEAAVFHILLREVAIQLDKKYPDHIECSKNIYMISMLDGGMFRLSDAQRKFTPNFRNFAAFRTVEDALFAKKTLSPIMESLYGKKKQKG